jgi:hypothetical protein
LSLLLWVLALLFPGGLLGVLLAMERVERRLDRDLLTDQVAWMLHSDLPADEVETSVAERLVVPLTAAADSPSR